MIFYWLLPLLGVLAGWLLFRRAGTPPLSHAALSAESVSLIIPARNEEANLPTLLRSLRSGSVSPAELIVVDDHSTDATASIARSFGATVLPAEPLPPGWTGKTWACHQGARRATGNLLLFLDADTVLAHDGLARLLAAYRAVPQPTALSVLPYHRTKCPYEQLSFFFQLIMAAGAGGFSGLVPQQLFGQSLLIDRSLYDAAGGHASVRSHVLENLHLAQHLRAAGANPIALLGDGAISMRMFPDGPHQLVEGWSKGFAAGAARTPTLTVVLVGVWIACTLLAPINLLLASVIGPSHLTNLYLTAAVYLAVALHLYLAARRLGSFSAWSSLVYPAMLFFYLGIFARSAWLRARGTGATWKGRSL